MVSRQSPPPRTSLSSVSYWVFSTESGREGEPVRGLPKTPAPRRGFPCPPRSPGACFEKYDRSCERCRGRVGKGDGTAEKAARAGEDPGARFHGRAGEGRIQGFARKKAVGRGGGAVGPARATSL